jgi:hypothetical protein
MNAYPVWPFLVSRNRTLGYRTVVAPDFLIQAGAAGILAEITPGERDATPRLCTLARTPAGPLAIIYHVVSARDEKTALLDGFGRPIDWVVGLIFKGKSAPSVSATTLTQAHRLVSPAYATFWQMTTPGPPQSAPAVLLSDGQLLEAADLTPAVRNESYSAGQRRLILVLASVIVVLVIAILWQWHHGQVLQVANDCLQSAAPMGHWR